MVIVIMIINSDCLINLTVIGKYTTILCTKNKTKVLPVIVVGGQQLQDTSNLKNVSDVKDLCLRINKIKNKTE